MRSSAHVELVRGLAYDKQDFLMTLNVHQDEQIVYLLSSKHNFSYAKALARDSPLPGPYHKMAHAIDELR